LAPVPFKVTDVPAHTDVDGEAVAPIVGSGLTVIVTVLVLLQPLDPVPVTVYVVVEEGINETPLVTPPVQLYEFAPVPFKVTDVPAHTVEDGDTVVPTVGNELTVIVMVLVLLQPLDPVPVTVYTEVENGKNETPFVTPPDQL
jgi:hypothetical protein